MNGQQVMNNSISNISISKAALTVGIAFVTSVVLVTIVDDLLLANFVVPGDAKQLALDISANAKLFDLAVVGYLLVLALDTIIGLALYIVLKPADEIRALLAATLRIVYATLLVADVLALKLQWIDVDGYAQVKLAGYVFFALHLFALGYAVLKSGYIPKTLGTFLIVASFTYLIFFVDIRLPEVLTVSVMFIMALAEIALSVWLIVKRSSLPENSAQITFENS